jgi:outer membrane murein-binding lipoprotein Lpp
MTLKNVLIITVGAVVLAALILAGIQSYRLKKVQDKLATELQKKTYEEEQVRIEKVYIPEKIEALTTDQLTQLLNAATVE